MSTAADIINQWASITGTPQLMEEVVNPQQEIPYNQPPRPAYDSGIPTYGQQTHFGGMMPFNFSQQNRQNPMDIKDEVLTSLAQLSVNSYLSLKGILSNGTKYFLVKTLRRNKSADELTVENFDQIEEPTEKQKAEYEIATQRLSRLEELEQFESSMTIAEFKKLLVSIKLSELKYQRDNGILEMPSMWSVTLNLLGLDVTEMVGNNLNIFNDLVYAFKK